MENDKASQLTNELKALLQLVTGRSSRGGESAFSLLDIIGEGIRIVDKDFRIVYENQAHRDIMGSHVGEHCYKAYQRRDQVCPDCAVSMSFDDGRVHQDARTVVTAEGIKYVEVTSSNLRDASGNVIAGVEIVRDVTERKKLEDEKEKLISDLQEALNNIKTLKGLIPVCAWCRKARSDKGYWDDLENYIRDHFDADFTHGICPECLEKTAFELNEPQD